MNKNIITIIVLFIIGLNTIDSYAAPVGSAFSYQGELADGGVPANGLYDVFLGLHPQDTGQVISVLEFLDIQVTNGLFIIPEIDFGNQDYNGDDVWLSVAFREAASIIGVTSYTTLSPRQRINAVPYAVQAEFLAPNGANNGDVLQFNGTDWVANAVNVNSPWTDNGTSVSYLGRVGVGVTNNLFGFQVKGSGTQHPFEVTDAGGVGIMRITDTGNIGIRTTTPQAELHVNGRVKIGFDPLVAKLNINETGNEVPFAVKRNGLLELLVEHDGGVTIGAGDSGTVFPTTIAPEKGLFVAGDFKTDRQSGGIIKGMVAAFCGGASSLIQRSYGSIVNIGSATFQISNVGVGICDITFPFTIDDRFMLTSAHSSTSEPKTVNCAFIAANQVRCRRFKPSTFESGNISVFIF